MPAARTEHLLPDGIGIEAARERLSARLRLEAGTVTSVDRTFYDTFDGRLHACGLQLVVQAGRLRLVNGLPDPELASDAFSGRPRRLVVADLPLGPLRELAAPIVDVRALLPIARIRSRVQTLRVLDGEAKTVVRLVLEEPLLVDAYNSSARLRARVHANAVRGYDTALTRTRRSLEEIGFPVAGISLLDRVVALSGGVPGGVSSKLQVAVQPGQRSDVAATVLLVHLAGTIEQNLPGTLADVDPEFLHDLRVAVRRTRSALRQLRGVFPADELAGFRGEFRWLQQVTGPTRDLDVYLLDFDELRSPLSVGQRADLEPIRRMLAHRRRREQRRMLRALCSPRADTLRSDWSVFLEGLVETPEHARPDAASPIAALAGERIAGVYRRMVRAGRAIDDATPPEALHELRKLGKELRYLLEFFASLYPPEVVKPMVGTLKALQDTLGRFQDREVQAGRLNAMREEVVSLADGPSALMAMGVLVARLEHDKAVARSEFAERFAVFAAKSQRALVRATFA
jgi:CHAD domain-containing protein